MRGCRGDRFWAFGEVLVENSFFWGKLGGRGEGSLIGKRVVGRMILRKLRMTKQVRGFPCREGWGG
jgi:hypothetical protein